MVKRAAWRGFTLIELMIVIAIISILASILVPNFLRARAQGQRTACQSNLRNVGVALEMYSIDWSARYPEELSKLVPSYLRSLPTCPAAGVDTYSASYTVARMPDAFTIFCLGANHLPVGLSNNQPFYTSSQGLGP